MRHVELSPKSCRAFVWVRGSSDDFPVSVSSVGRRPASEHADVGLSSDLQDFFSGGKSSNDLNRRLWNRKIIREQRYEREICLTVARRGVNRYTICRLGEFHDLGLFGVRLHRDIDP
jgi:hypothetical protein